MSIDKKGYGCAYNPEDEQNIKQKNKVKIDIDTDQDSEQENETSQDEKNIARIWQSAKCLNVNGNNAVGQSVTIDQTNGDDTADTDQDSDQDVDVDIDVDQENEVED